MLAGDHLHSEPHKYFYFSKYYIALSFSDKVKANCGFLDVSCLLLLLLHIVGWLFVWLIVPLHVVSHPTQW